MPVGRLGHIGLAKETVFGTPVAATAYFRFRSENLPMTIEEVTPPNILGVFDEGPTYQGLKTHAGDIEFDAHPNILGWFLLSALGPVTTTGTGPDYTHTFSARQTDFSALCAVQPLTLEIHRDLGQAFQYAGSAVNTFRFAFGVDAKVLGCTAGIIAKTMTRITKTTPVFEATTAFRWNQATITLPHPTTFTTMDSLAVTIDGGLEGRAFIDGTQEIARIRPARSRVISISGRMIGNDTELTAFINGSERPLRCVFTGPALGSTNYKLEIECPAFRYTAYPVRITGPDEIMVEFEGKAKYDPNVANTPMRIVLVNSQAAY